MSAAVSCIPTTPLLYQISEDDYLGDGFVKMNLNFCKIDSELNKVHRIGDFKRAFIDDDHDGWKIVDTPRDLPRELYPQLECLLAQGKICLFDPTTYRLPIIEKQTVNCNGTIKTLHSFLYVGNPVFLYEPPPISKCFIPYDLEDGTLDFSFLNTIIE